ncbi:MAG TPA: recombinase family protein [Stellaceae bacterium]|nr:recombinase family protein [Stellaceae bacterium]
MSKSSAGPSQRRHTLRCAVYTRKSSEEGLEQEFNSLHAQREACEAFITSQRHEGWACLPQAYDDGGISGGTMERPALLQLLGDIRAGKVDVVVTYKIDRLTRSLADFAKITEIFDAKGVSFVSVTQQFNTTTSMGRLTLNVLLSFAQFEREVTSERIRDKIAASKRKGMWMGGMPPLGYEVRDHKLVVVPREAETVRHIFRRYVALGSVRLLKEELAAHGVVSKQRPISSGRSWGGKPLARGALYLMLQNRIYRGDIVHKDQAYPGEHKPIIDPDLWDTVQARLSANAVERHSGARAKNPSLLAGLVFDGDGNRMTPTHAVKKGTRYRYYVSHPLITQVRAGVPGGLRVPAPEIEQLVADRIRQFLSEPDSIIETTEPQWLERGHRQLIDRATEMANSWAMLPPMQTRALLRTLIQRIDLHPDRVDMHIYPSRLAAVLGTATPVVATDHPADQPTLTLSIAAQLRRTGKAMTLRIERNDASPAKPNPSLIKLIVRAHLFKRRLLQSGGGKFADLARNEKLNRSYYSRVVRLSYLAPDITRAILEGRQPPGLTAAKLINDASLPLGWPEQRAALGFT